MSEDREYIEQVRRHGNESAQPEPPSTRDIVKFVDAQALSIFAYYQALLRYGFEKQDALYLTAHAKF